MPAAVRVVAQPDRRGQLRKADRRHVRLVGWWAGGLVGWALAFFVTLFRGMRGNGIIHRGQKPIQGEDNGHVGRPG